MTTKAAFSDEEWKVVLEGPPTAGMIVITAAHGGMFRETVAMSKAYVEARGQHGERDILQNRVAKNPRLDTTGLPPPNNQKPGGPAPFRAGGAWRKRKAPAEEREDYGRFVLTLPRKVAAPPRGGGKGATPA